LSVDLHLHSRYSDGTAEPAELVEMAIAAGLSAVALTDHDIFEGIEQARTTAAGRIRFIPGIELSVDWPGPGLHLLAWWVEPGSPLDLELEEVRQSRAERNLAMIAALNELGHPVTLEQVMKISEKGVVGRPHLAQALLELGVVETEGQAFAEYLASGRPAYRSRKRFSLERAVELVGVSGGVTAVAHPHTVADNAEEFAAAFDRFAALGITGVECWYSEYPPGQRFALAEMAARRGLVATGGSDYHGSHKPGIEVGTGRGDLTVPDEVVEALEARRP